MPPPMKTTTVSPRATSRLSRLALAAVAAFGAQLPTRLKACVLSVQAAIALAFLLFIVLTSSIVTVFFRRKSEAEALARDRAKDDSVLAS